jgi:hypothetical protein
MPEFDGFHAGLCRTLLTQMSEFDGSIKSHGSCRVAPLQRRNAGGVAAAGRRQRRWLPYALTIMADTAILDGAAKQVKVPTLIAGGAKPPGPTQGGRGMSCGLGASTAMSEAPFQPPRSTRAHQSLVGQRAAARICPNAGRHPRAGPSCCQVTKYRLGKRSGPAHEPGGKHP